MNIHFPPVDENFIKAKVEDGYYSNATELVRDAVRRLREQEDSKYNRLMAALQQGRDAAKKGDVLAYTPELLDEIEQEAIQHAAEGNEPDADVCP